jgi:hypothetical protein
VTPKNNCLRDQLGIASSLALLFNEVINISKAERDMRMIARKNDIPLLQAEEIWKTFQRFDVDERGSLSYPDFAQVVRAMAVRRDVAVSVLPIGGAAHAVENVPESRIRHLWHDVDSDGSGQVEFEEFLLWFYAAFYRGQDETVISLHSDRRADSVTERFYASLGRNRLRNWLEGQYYQRGKQYESESATVTGRH